MATSPILDRRNLDFILYELLAAEALCRWQRFDLHSRETFDAAIDLAHQVALSKFYNHNRLSDLHEPRMVDGKVVLIPELVEGVNAFVDAGFMAILASTERGGMQMPFLLASSCDAIFAAANSGTGAYPMLARAAANLLEVYANAEQKTKYLQPILDGRFFGTMCLSEPQAGSSLADITTTAYPQSDGSYRLRGAKMWISAGDHEIGENIVHLVLARIAGAPAGVRGISLFVCPRFCVDAEGQVTHRNDVHLAGVNHKMGQRGSVNTFLKFGEQDRCYAELVGEPQQGLAAMFHMMNEERIGVGMGAVQQGIAGYLCALQYARERKQGRPIEQKDPSAPQIPIIGHADVRRMLLRQRAFVEAGQLMCLFAAKLVDEAHYGPQAQRETAAQLLDLLTPVVKAWCSDTSLEANNLAIQIHGGYGYTREYAVEQCWRDNRINPIHEGTNGIQALDLLGRKVMQHGGAGLRELHRQVQAVLNKAAVHPDLQAMADALQSAMALLASTTTRAVNAMQAGDARAVLANSEHYLQALGHTCAAWLWLWQAECAHTALLVDGLPEQERNFYLGKIQTAKFFFATELPRVVHLATLVGDVERSALEMQDAWF